MKCIINILWFLIKLPFRLIAVILVIPLSIFGIMINIVLNMSGAVIGLFNTFMLLATFGILYTKDLGMLWSVGAVILVEAIMFFLVGVALGTIEILKDSLMSFAFGY